MLRRVPPVVLAAIATAVVAAVVVAVVVLTGNAAGRQVAPCTDALDAGPYGCVVLVSIDGTVDGRAAAEPQGGAITIRIERTDGRDQLIFTGDCKGGEGPVTVSATRFRVGDLLNGQVGCQGVSGKVDAWGSRLLSGTVRVDDRDDGTVVLTNGAYSARFDQVVAAR